MHSVRVTIREAGTVRGTTRRPHFSLAIISVTVQLRIQVFWAISVYFNVRNILPKSGTFPPGHPVYKSCNECQSVSSPQVKHTFCLPLIYLDFFISLPLCKYMHPCIQQFTHRHLSISPSPYITTSVSLHFFLSSLLAHKSWEKGTGKLIVLR